MNLKDKLVVRKMVRNILFVFLETCVIVGITLFAVAPTACKITSSGIEIVGGDYVAPVLQNVNVVDEKTVILEFSEGISLVTSVVSPLISGISDSDEHSDSLELSPSVGAACGEYGSVDFEVEILDDGKTLIYNFGNETEVGKSYEIFGIVKDQIGNSLTFTVPFAGYNSRIPKVIMTEIHTGMASQLTSEKELNIRRLEYVEFLALTDGNLVGLEFCSGLYGDGKNYKFPAVEVKKGEKFVLHNRTWGNGCVSEEGEDLTLAFSEYTSDVVRDLWESSTSRTIGEKTDIVVLKNCVTGEILDGVMYKEESVEDWSEKLKIDYSVFDDFGKIYPSGDSDYTVITDSAENLKLSALNSMQRKNVSGIMEILNNDDEIDYPVNAEEYSWFIDKATLPLK